MGRRNLHTKKENCITLDGYSSPEDSKKAPQNGARVNYLHPYSNRIGISSK